MSGASADPVRRQASLILNAVMHDGRSLDAVLVQADDLGTGGARCRSLVYSVCRWYPRLDAVLGKLLNKPLRRRDSQVHVVLLMALTELVYLDHPAHGVVDSAVTLTRQLSNKALSGLVNALLRRFLRERDALLAEVDRDPAVASAHPRWLYDLIKQDWPAQSAAVLEGNNARAPMTLRVGAGIERGDYAARLDEAGMVNQPGPGGRDLVLAEPADVAALPGFDNGHCSVQDSAAQCAALLLNPGSGERVLDACAAPGGKTGHLLEVGCAPENLTVLDASDERMARVDATLGRLGFAGVTRVAADARDLNAWWDGVPFDAVLLDAPCTGLGVVRRHPDIKLLRRASDLGNMTALQAELLDTLWPLVKPGGRLLYATCSTARRENDRQISDFLRRTSDARTGAISLAVGQPCQVGWQILPGEMGCDGFYYALMHRQPDSAAA